MCLRPRLHTSRWSTGNAVTSDERVVRVSPREGARSRSARALLPALVPVRLGQTGDDGALDETPGGRAAEQVDALRPLGEPELDPRGVERHDLALDVRRAGVGTLADARLPRGHALSRLPLERHGGSG